MSQVTEQELAGLSQAEREALSPEDTNAAAAGEEDHGGAGGADDAALAAAEAAAAAPIAGAAKTDDAAAGDDAAKAKAVADAAEAAKVAAAAAGADNDVQDERIFTPSFRADAPENYDQRIADITKAFEASEMSLAEYNKQRDELLASKIKADISADHAKQTAEQRWEWEIDRFMDDVRTSPDLGKIDYSKNPMLQAALDVAVKDIAGRDENKDKSGRFFLTEAHKLVMAQFGRAGVDLTADEKAAQAAEAAKAAAAGRRPNLTAVPRTLASAPAAAGDDVNAGEFDSIDKMEGLDLERALAKMNPEQRERYARGG